MYCPSCGERVDGEAQYCRHCGKDVRDQDTGIDRVDSIDRATKVEHQCQDCGEMLNSGDPPCRHCGGMNIESREITPDTATGASATAESGGHPPDESGRHTNFYIGAVLGVFGVIFAPYVFFLVALPESLLGLRGGSLQNYFGDGGRNNPFVSGSLLIMRWFGNFIILLFILGVIIGFLYVL